MGGQTPEAVVCRVSCRGTGNIRSPNAVSTGLRVGQAAWFLIRITCGAYTWLFVDWEGSFPIKVLEIVISDCTQAPELQRLLQSEDERFSGCVGCGRHVPSSAPGSIPRVPRTGRLLWKRLSAGRGLRFAFEFWDSRLSVALRVQKAPAPPWGWQQVPVHRVALGAGSRPAPKQLVLLPFGKH